MSQNPHLDRLNKETKHFNELANKQGASWWGHRSRLGQLRLKRRGREISALMQEVGASVAVDLGCGAGELTRHIQPENCHVFAVDLSLGLLRILPEFVEKNIEPLCADGCVLPMPDKSLDLIFGNGILHHLPLENVFLEISRVLRPGGSMLFYEPNMINPIVALEKNVRFIGKLLQSTEDETAFFHWKMKRDLLNTGFENVCVEPFDFAFPAIPDRFATPVDSIGRIIERIPGIKEIGGSLRITASIPRN